MLPFFGVFMHELAIAESLLSLIKDEMRKHDVHRLLLVRVRYGALTAIVPEALQFAFESLTAGTEMQGAVLEMEKVPLTLRCMNCGTIFTPQEEENVFVAVCPKCHEEIGHQVETGRELFLQHLEAE